MQNFLKNPHQYQWRPNDFVQWFMKCLKVNNLNSVFMKDIFHTHQILLIKSIIYISVLKITKFGNKSLRVFGANIWNNCPDILNRLLHC